MGKPGIISGDNQAGNGMVNNMNFTPFSMFSIIKNFKLASKDTAKVPPEP
jgi:hypothetical protein